MTKKTKDALVDKVSDISNVASMETPVKPTELAASLEEVEQLNFALLLAKIQKTEAIVQNMVMQHKILVEQDLPSLQQKLREMMMGFKEKYSLGDQDKINSDTGLFERVK